MTVRATTCQGRCSATRRTSRYSETSESSASSAYIRASWEYFSWNSEKVSAAAPSRAAVVSKQRASSAYSTGIATMPATADGSRRVISEVPARAVQ